MLRKIWIELRSSLWFVPSLLVLAAIVVAFALIEVDVRFGSALTAEALRPFLAASADGARSMLAAIAGSMITVAGVAFSITIVTLSLASTQYTPRILRNFMGDRANQAVLGAFLAIFAYCLIVLRGIRSPDEGAPFVPVLAVFVGVLLALLSVGCLIFFIHHVAASIQASYILRIITADTAKTCDAMFPDPHIQGGAASPPGASAEIEWHPVASSTSGYIQAINSSAVVDFARDENLFLRIDRAPGDFVPEGGAIVWADQPLNEKLQEKLRRAWVVGDFRTVEQDPGFGIRQIVDIALKALSPGVNDTSTAVSAIDYLSALLCRLAPRKLTPLFAAGKENDRVIAPPITFADYVNKMFDEIRIAALGNVTILLQMICAITRIGTVTVAEERKGDLAAQLRVIAEAADHSIPAARDRQRINTELVNARAVLGIDERVVPALSEVRKVEPW